MKRAASIEALLKKAKADFVGLKTAYEASLHEERVRDELRVAIKNIFENLRSCLDYAAHDVYDSLNTGTEPNRLYFPVRSTAADFNAMIAKEYPGLAPTAPLFLLLESVQPYREAWLGQFNKLNNNNKHQDLVEQTRTESSQVAVKSPSGGSVVWSGDVRFNGDVRIMGVPIDLRTQLPVQNSVVTTTVNIWVDFRFKEVGESVLPFIEKSIAKVEKLFKDLRVHLPA